MKETLFIHLTQLFMKHFILWGLTLAAVVLGGCSDDYDDTELRTGLNDLRDRVAKLETQLTKLNGEITTIDALVRKLESNVSVVKVEPGTDGKSYTIYFSDDTKAVIANGEDGAAGKDAPVIGVKEEDGVYYWAQTIDGKTTILEVDGQKLRVTAEVTPPRLSVDEEGYWEASYDGGDTWERITNAAGEPVKAVTDDGSSIQDSFFSAVTQDDGNVYFTLTDGSVITVAKRTDFYLILRKAPDVAPFVYGETKTYEIESAGVAETILTKPDGWRVALKDDVLSVTAPAADAAGFEAEGTVAVIYFDGAERSSVAKLGVVVDKSQTGVTEGDDFTIDITEVTDKSVTATVTPKDASIYYYVSAYDAETFDEKGEAAVVAELKAMFDFYVQYGMWDYYKETLMSKGTATYTTPEATPLAAGASYYLIAFGLEENSEGTALIPNTAVMKVPFKTTTPVVVNTKYRVTVDNITWYGAGYSVVPSDDLHYFHGIVKKSAFTGGQGQPLTDAEVAAAYVKEYENRYYDELYLNDPTTIKWTDLSSCGTQRQVVPRVWIRENELANEAIRPLVAETDYCLIAFGVDGKELRTDVAKKEFRTPAFTPTEECTFDLDVTVSRQNLSIKVTPSNKNLTYICHLDKSATYYEFENDMQYAADDLFWTKYNLEAGRTLSDELLTGDIEMKAENLWASTGYVVYAYGCTADGVITTPLTSVRVLTEAGSDTPPATAAKPRLVRVR
jgi:putative lipoprotein